MNAKDKEYPDYAGLQAVRGVDAQNYPQVVTYPVAYQDQNQSRSSEPENEAKRICGLRPTTFWIVFAAASVIIVAAVIGGVLGAVLPKALKEKR